MINKSHGMSMFLSISFICCWKALHIIGNNQKDIIITMFIVILLLHFSFILTIIKSTHIYHNHQHTLSPYHTISSSTSLHLLIYLFSLFLIVLFFDFHYKTYIIIIYIIRKLNHFILSQLILDIIY